MHTEVFSGKAERQHLVGRYVPKKRRKITDVWN
jgi:hypothetical protein